MTFRQVVRHFRSLFDPRRWFEPTWTDELSCRWWLFRYALCDWQTRGKHKWGLPRMDSVLRWSRTCCRCKSTETLPISYTQQTTASNASITWTYLP